MSYHDTNPQPPQNLPSAEMMAALAQDLDAFVLNIYRKVRQHTLAEIRASEAAADSTAEVDFRVPCIRRHGYKDERLDPCLAWPMLERLLRRPTMSLTSFLLLPRSRPPKVSRNLPKFRLAFRKEKSVFAKKSGRAQLPLVVHHPMGTRLAVRIDWSRLRTNITDGRRPAKEALAHRLAENWTAAIERAREALRCDTDNDVAASVAASIAEIDPALLDAETVWRAQVCLARRQLVSWAAMRRLKTASSSDPHANRAAATAKRLINRSRLRWDTLRRWPSATRRSSPEPTTEIGTLRHFVTMFVDTIAGDTHAYTEWLRNPIVYQTAAALATQYLPTGATAKRKDQCMKELRPALFTTLSESLWLPAATPSQAQLSADIARFTRRKIRWDEVLGQSDETPELSNLDTDDAEEIDEDDASYGKFRRSAKTRTKRKRRQE